jgi:hypothetical protein
MKQSLWAMYCWMLMALLLLLGVIAACIYFIIIPMAHYSPGGHGGSSNQVLGFGVRWVLEHVARLLALGSIFTTRMTTLAGV